ncbi:hypothetical protein NDN08_004036 [Rhodosorus marinus]|uniref:DNA polymerase delta subunit 3 n=1 Tax=Rhodosorus marinus TaxID=101924 RepID=A0AAV8UK36_9RHOD|nr:hypothetical protein NDN08_004036 [Rhodosorus marinus]
MSLVEFIRGTELPVVTYRTLCATHDVSAKEARRWMEIAGASSSRWESIWTVVLKSTDEEGPRKKSSVKLLAAKNKRDALCTANSNGWEALSAEIFALHVLGAKLAESKGQELYEDDRKREFKQLQESPEADNPLRTNRYSTVKSSSAKRMDIESKRLEEVVSKPAQLGSNFSKKIQAVKVTTETASPQPKTQADELKDPKSVESNTAKATDASGGSTRKQTKSASHFFKPMPPKKATSAGEKTEPEMSRLVPKEPADKVLNAKPVEFGSGIISRSNDNEDSNGVDRARSAQNPGTDSPRKAGGKRILVEDEESDEEETFDPYHEPEDDPDEELPKENQEPPTQESYIKNDSAEDGSENKNRSSTLKTVNQVQRTGNVSLKRKVVKTVDANGFVVSRIESVREELTEERSTKAMASNEEASEAKIKDSPGSEEPKEQRSRKRKEGDLDSKKTTASSVEKRAPSSSPSKNGEAERGAKKVKSNQLGIMSFFKKK